MRSLRLTGRRGTDIWFYLPDAQPCELTIAGCDGSTVPLPSIATEAAPSFPSANAKAAAAATATKSNVADVEADAALAAGGERAWRAQIAAAEAALAADKRAVDSSKPATRQSAEGIAFANAKDSSPAAVAAPAAPLASPPASAAAPLAASATGAVSTDVASADS